MVSAPAGPCGHVDRQLCDARAQACGDDDRRGATAGDDRACVHHVELVGQRRSGWTGPGGFLPHRQRFAGEQRLVDLEPVRGNEPGVGRHAVARFEPEQVAWHDLFGWDFADGAPAADGRADLEELLERPTGTVCLGLLPRAETDIDRDHRGDDGGILGVADGQRHQRRREQQQHERVCQLKDGEAPHRRRRLAGERIGAEGREATGRLGGRQPLAAAAHAVQHVVEGQRMPGLVVKRRASFQMGYGRWHHANSISITCCWWSSTSGIAWSSCETPSTTMVRIGPASRIPCPGWWTVIR